MWPVSDFDLAHDFDRCRDRHLTDLEGVIDRPADGRGTASEGTEQRRSTIRTDLFVVAGDQANGEARRDRLRYREIEMEGVARSVIGRRILAVDLKPNRPRNVEPQLGIEPSQRARDVANRSVELNVG